MRARDVSNYSADEIEPLMAQWYADGDRLVLIQAFPATYPQYAEQQRQIAAAEALGMQWDAYIYDYLGDPTWRNGALHWLRVDHEPRTVWLDEEDVETERGWTPSARVLAMHASVSAVEQLGFHCGIYSAKWWWEPLTANNDEFNALPLWVADYDGVEDTSVWLPFGGWSRVAVKQYAGTQPDGTDLNVLSPEEEAEVMGTPEQPAEFTDREKDLINRLGYAHGDLVAKLRAESNRKSPTTGRLVAPRRAVLNPIVDELERVTA